MTLRGALLPGWWCQTRPGATESEIAAVERELGNPLPDDYKAVLSESNGLEGFVAPEAYISLWSSADIRARNDGYGVAEFLPGVGVVLIGTDGGGTGYGFAWERGKVRYISVPLIGMEPCEVSTLGSTFSELLDRLRTGSSSATT